MPLLAKLNPLKRFPREKYVVSDELSSIAIVTNIFKQV